MEPFNISSNCCDEHCQQHHAITESYLSAPLYMQKRAQPKMRGGPFMDFAGGRIEEVNALHQSLCKNRQS
jgi:hypothetical protein